MRARYERVAAGAGQFFVLKRRRDPAFPFTWHHHGEFELTLILRSRGRRFVGDHIEEYREGDLVLLGPDLPHTWASFPDRGGRHEAIVVQFAEDLLGPGRLLAADAGLVRLLLDKARRGLRFRGRTRREIAVRLEALETHSAIGRLGELLGILDRLSRSRDAALLSSRTFVPRTPSGRAHPMDLIWRFLDERYLDRVPLAEAAGVIGMSPSAFSRFFHRTTGKTFTSYVNELRIGHACRLLAETDRGIADIADAAGFSNLSNFNRIFLRSKKVRPRDFRREFRRHALAE